MNTINSRDDKFDDDGVPSGYTLEQLVLLHRHGERTVVVSRFPEIGGLDFRGACARTRSFSVQRSSSGELKFEERFLDAPVVTHGAASADDCAMGQLTDRGAQTLEKLGENLRTRYVDRLGLLPSRFAPSTLLVQSTDIPRAMASARNLLAGLYPAKFRDGNAAPALHIRKPESEVIYPNWGSCPELRRLSDVWRRAGTLQQDMDEFKEQFPVLFGLEPPPTTNDSGVPGTAAPKPIQSVLPSHSKSTHAYFDENAVRAAHDLPLLPGSTPESLKAAGNLSVREWFGHYDHPNRALKTEVCRLGIGPLFRDMVEQITTPNPRKAVLYSGHDTSLVPFLSCIGAYDGAWPKYGANAALEILSKKGSTDKFVQLRYNFQRRVMSECAEFAPKDARTLCPMDRFLAIVKPLTPTTSEWEAECHPKK